MAKTVSATLTAASSADTSEGYAGTVTSSISFADSLADANAVHIDCKLTILSAANEVKSTQGPDVFGATLATIKVFAVFIECDSSSAGTLKVEPAAANGWLEFMAAGSIDLPAGASMLRRSVAGLVTSPTSDDLKFTAVGGDVVVRVIILGSTV